MNKHVLKNVEESKSVFTFAEVESLGIVALEEFNNEFGLNIATFKISDLKRLYIDIIHNHGKYKSFAEWLYPRFKKFIDWNIPMRIYVGGKKQFILREDEQLEKALKNTLDNISEYIATGKATPKRISILFYYMNLMFK